MMILDGKVIANSIYEQLRCEVEYLRQQGVVPHIALLLVGDNPASLTYVRAKSRACERVGIRSTVLHLPAETSEEEVLWHIQQWNVDPTVHGILVQLPLPTHIDSERVILSIDPLKDVDGFHPVNIGRMLIGLPSFVPCTPAGIIELLRRYDVSVRGKHVVVVGRSLIVGKPVANLLLQKAPWADAIVTVCHSATANLRQYTRSADVLIVAVGRAEFITADDVREGAVVIDVGINRVPDDTSPNGYRIVGDVAFASVAPKVSAITPVPGGVGPMTIAMLLRNTVNAANGQAWRKHLFQ
ncbi:MAG: bifunctional methylenetetrahydrofolate dehydrogenase/methenyltetrahydrofolate cyclohydrolase FolD [Candidatus Kapabacteria bacterium]|nr:bifunctional methylenetetrahydrofolate dehydrogenase/methenyltetrahydrofolate cyclohydrolase FolD [Candidatus Kapabacteria bacterium]